MNILNKSKRLARENIADSKLFIALRACKVKIFFILKKNLSLHSLYRKKMLTIQGGMEKSVT